MKKYSSAENYYQRAEMWREGLLALRAILLESSLKEELKWGMPCYTLAGKNVVGISGFKSYFGLWFYQGAFLKDEGQFLINAQTGKTKGMRQWRFSAVEQVNKDLIQAYIEEAAVNAAQGKEIAPDRNKPLLLPDLLKVKLDSNSEFARAFSAFTMGQQREYANHITEAKRDATKLRRLDKIVPLILSGVGLNDKYRK